MTKKAYTISGEFQMGRDRQPFKVQMVGRDEDDARDHLYKDFGSRHRVKRRDIRIASVEAVPDAEQTDITKKRMARD